MALVYGAVTRVAFTAVCLLAVDYGRVRVVKLELQSDAAARNRADNRQLVRSLTLTSAGSAGPG